MSLAPFVHLDASLRGAWAGDGFPLSADDLHHLGRVLRLREGARLEVCDRAGGVAPATLRARDVALRADPVFVPRALPSLWVAQALPKGRKLDEVVRMVTELGADGLVPVLAERSVARPDDARAERLRLRAEAVARAAGEQSRRAWGTDVAPLTPVGDLAEQVTGRDPDRSGVAGPDAARGLLLVAHPDAPGLPEVLAGIPDVERICLAVGPEGGWSDPDLAVLEAAGGIRVGLGPTILRTEHAAAAGIAVIAACTGRWS